MAAKKKKTKYARSSKRDVESEMRRYKKGTAKSGRGGKGGKVKSRKQAIAIGLSKARKKGKKMPKEIPVLSAKGSTRTARPCGHFFCVQERGRMRQHQPVACSTTGRLSRLASRALVVVTV